MLKMGVPRSAVALKMAADGVDPRDVRTFETEGLDDDALEEARRKAGGDVATLFLRLPGRSEGVMGGRGGVRRRGRGRGGVGVGGGGSVGGEQAKDLLVLRLQRRERLDLRLAQPDEVAVHLVQPLVDDERALAVHRDLVEQLAQPLVDLRGRDDVSRKDVAS